MYTLEKLQHNVKIDSLLCLSKSCDTLVEENTECFLRVDMLVVSTSCPRHIN